VALDALDMKLETHISFYEGKELGASCQVDVGIMLGSGAHFDHEINQWSSSYLV
jgi:hypothetical protein